MIKKTLLGIVAAAVLSVPAYSGTSATASRSLPHYLQDMPTKYTDEVDQLTTKFVAYNSMKSKYPERPPADFFNGSITVIAPVYGKNVEFIFKNYREEVSKADHKRTIVAHYNGQGREELTLEEFEVVKKDIISTQVEASQQAYERHKNLEKGILSVLETQCRESKLLKDNEKLADKLDVLVAQGVTVADALYLPRIEVTDFVPKKHIFGPIPALGMAYLNSGWVYYDPKARALDYVDKAPNVLIHECVHNNIKLQRIPFVSGFDEETWASLPILEKSDAIEFLKHPYYEDVRHISKVLFGFDSDLAFEKSFFMTAGGVKIDRDRLSFYIQQIKQISKIIQDTAMKDFMKEYYAHFSFWSTVNEELKDGNAAFKVYMYFVFEPTLLGGPQTTLKWLEMNKLIIDEASKKAKENLVGIGTPQEKKDAQKTANEVLRELNRAGIHAEKPEVLYNLYEKLVALGYIRR